MGAELIRNQKDDVIGIKLTDVVFSYAYLLSPRPESDLKKGTYGADLLIDLTDTEAIQTLSEYVNDVKLAAKASAWGNKLPKNLKMPYRQGEGDKNELETGKLVLKTSTKSQPALYIKDSPEDDPRKVDDIEELESTFYSGMIGEAFVKITPFSYQNTSFGISAWLSAVCRTDEGTPISSKADYEDIFKGTNRSVFASKKTDTKKKPVEQDEPEVEDTLASLTKQTSKASTTPKKTAKTILDEPEVEEEFSLDSLLAGK